MIQRPWLGSSMAMRLDQRAWPALASIFGRDYRSTMQARCSNNLPILNEWKRRYPDHDPVELHEGRGSVYLEQWRGERWNQPFMVTRRRPVPDRRHLRTSAICSKLILASRLRIVEFALGSSYCVSPKSATEFFGHWLTS